MMLALHGRPSDTDAFLYVLAQDLGMSVAAVMDLDNIELLNWRAFYTARHANQNQR